MFVPLAEATAEECGGKAASLGALSRAGLPVPDGTVLPFAVHRAALHGVATRAREDQRHAAVRQGSEAPQLPLDVFEAVKGTLVALGDPPVAVRSSASTEDTAGRSAAGQYVTVLGVSGATDVAEAVRVCWASLHSVRATAYRTHVGDDLPVSDDPAMAVIVQRHVDAEVSGVMFTPAAPEEPTLIEASWGLGPSVVGGTVTPDAYRVHTGGAVGCTPADKPTRLDRFGGRIVARRVTADRRGRPCLDQATATRLAMLGREVAATLGAAQDVEWVLADGRLWLVQSRPVTAPPPAPAREGSSEGSVPPMTGTPGSGGTATGTARTVRGPRDFARVRPGDILICPFTDPAWTPLLRIAAGVVTETGGVLSHAAIVARERRIPAVLGVPGATTGIPDGLVVTIDGTAGTVVSAEAGP